MKVSVLASTGKKETEFQKRLTTKLVDKKGDKVLKDLRGERFNVPKLITTLGGGVGGGLVALAGGGGRDGASGLAQAP